MHVRARVEDLCSGDGVRERELYSTVSTLVCKRLEYCGLWDERCIDDIPSECLPLHMPAVKEALGALIPARLHRSLDKAVQKQKQDLGEVRGGNTLSLEGWRVSVRAEDALSQGVLQEEVLELFLKLLSRICRQLMLPVAIGSKTVGKHAGRQESPSKLASIMEHWRKVWDGRDVRASQVLALPVAVDEGDKPKDWMCVFVCSTVLE